MLRKTGNLLAIVIFIMATGSASWADDKVSCSREKLAVYNFKGADGEQMATLLTTFLGQSKSLVVIERQQMETAMKEIRLSYDDIFNQDQALRLGKFLNAKCIVVGEITPGLNGANTVTARVLYTETGEVVTATFLEAASKDINAWACNVANSLHEKIIGGGLQKCPSVVGVARPKKKNKGTKTLLTILAVGLTAYLVSNNGGDSGSAPAAAPDSGTSTGVGTVTW